MKRTLMNKPVYLGLLILYISKTVMYEFSYDYVKPKYREKPKLCYVGTNNFIVYVKTKDIYVDISKGVKATFITSNCELKRPLPKGKKKQLD